MLEKSPQLKMVNWEPLVRYEGLEGLSYFKSGISIITLGNSVLRGNGIMTLWRCCEDDYWYLIFLIVVSNVDIMTRWVEQVLEQVELSGEFRNDMTLL